MFSCGRVFLSLAGLGIVSIVTIIVTTISK